MSDRKLQVVAETPKEKITYAGDPASMEKLYAEEFGGYPDCDSLETACDYCYQEFRKWLKEND